MDDEASQAESEYYEKNKHCHTQHDEVSDDATVDDHDDVNATYASKYTDPVGMEANSDGSSLEIEGASLEGLVPSQRASDVSISNFSEATEFDAFNALLGTMDIDDEESSTDDDSNSTEKDITQQNKENAMDLSNIESPSMKSMKGLLVFKSESSLVKPIELTSIHLPPDTDSSHLSDVRQCKRKCVEPWLQRQRGRKSRVAVQGF